MKVAVLAAALALVATGCGGGDRYARERERVAELVPGASAIRCTGEPRRDAYCTALAGPRGWECEFQVHAPSSETFGCWSRGGP